MLAESTSQPPITAHFSIPELVKAMLAIQKIAFSVETHGKLCFIHTEDIVVVISEWSRPIDSRTLFNIFDKLGDNYSVILLISDSLSGHATEMLSRRKLPIIVIHSSEITQILDYF